MSDFDEEAERERLREKYERDKQKRENSERMSELLLKGATMTNAHCDTCGDPIFRYDGQEFCPTCQQPTGQAEAAADQQAPDAEPAPEPEQGPAADAPDQPSAPEPPEVEPTAEPAANGDPTPEPEPEPRRVEPPSPDVDADAGGLADARAALERTLADAARRAEAADDARSRREHLGAAKEAAEALAALRNAR